MKNYEEVFIGALENSKELGIWEKDFAFNNMTYIAEWLMYELGPKIAENFSRKGYIKFLGQPQNAIRVHHLFKPIVDKLLNVDSIVTTGYVKVPNDANEVEIFGQISKEDIVAAIETKELPEKIHNWLTLPSGEIIDLTFMTIYGLLYREDSLIGNIVAKAAKNLTGDMEYYPVALGEKLYEMCGFDFAYDKALYLNDEEEDDEE